MSKTARLKLPFIYSGQAQKEITHTEALNILDILLHPVVEDMDTEVLQDKPKTGELYIIAAHPKDNKLERYANHIVAKLEHGWQYIKPPKWLKVTLDYDGSCYQFDGNNWRLVSMQPEPQELALKATDYLIKKDTGEYLQVVHLQEEISVQGTHVNTQIKIPHHSIVIAVSVRVLEAITGTNTFNVGVEGELNKYGNNLNVAQDTTNLGLTNHPLSYWQDTVIRITAGNGSFNGGRVNIPYNC